MCVFRGDSFSIFVSVSHMQVQKKTREAMRSEPEVKESPEDPETEARGRVRGRGRGGKGRGRGREGEEREKEGEEGMKRPAAIEPHEGEPSRNPKQRQRQRQKGKMGTPHQGRMQPTRPMCCIAKSLELLVVECH